MSPLVYDPSFEVPEADEAATGQALIDTMRKISETTFYDLGHAVRSVHAKSHGLLSGELVVAEGLPEPLAQGLFAKPGRHPIVMRFSTIPGDVLDDKVSTPRGLALKVLDVEGERLPGSETATTQDFLFVNGPAFGAPTAKAFLKNLKLVAATTDKAPGLKVAVSAAFQFAEKVIEAAGGKSSTLLTLGGHPETHVLGETYFTQVPTLYGRYIAKLSVAPASANLKALTGAKVDLHDRPDGLRDAVVAYFATEGGQWDLRVQLCTNRETMPIEDSSTAWSEEESPFVTVARITLDPQPAWNKQRASAVDDAMSFSPWHGVAAHRPLGSIMRVRKATYEQGRRFRAEHNAVAIEEPARGYALPD